MDILQNLFRYSGLYSMINGIPCVITKDIDCLTMMFRISIIIKS